MTKLDNVRELASFNRKVQEATLLYMDSDLAYHDCLLENLINNPRIIRIYTDIIDEAKRRSD